MLYKHWPHCTEEQRKKLVFGCFVKVALRTDKISLNFVFSYVA